MCKTVLQLLSVATGLLMVAGLFTDLVYPYLLVALMVSVIAWLVQTLVIDAKAVGRKPRRTAMLSTTPEAVFQYRGQKLVGLCLLLLGWLIVLAGVATAPLLWMHCDGDVLKGLLGAAAVFLLLCGMGAVLMWVGRLYQTAAIELYEDRIVVRGIYSNGHLRWNELTQFTHVKTDYARYELWTYWLHSSSGSLRMEDPIRDLTRFVELVERKSGLKLEETKPC
jgi:hypothetical protein